MHSKKYIASKFVNRGAMLFIQVCRYRLSIHLSLDVLYYYYLVLAVVLPRSSHLLPLCETSLLISIQSKKISCFTEVNRLKTWGKFADAC